MKEKEMNKIGLFSIVLALIVVCSACNKTPIEKVKYPQKIELLVGQYCFPKVFLDESEHENTFWESYSSSSSSSSSVYFVINGDTVDYSGNYQEPMFTFSDWESSNSNVAQVRYDTVLALSAGECELVGYYHNQFGNQKTTCMVMVSDLQIPSSNDTIFTHYGDTISLCEFDVPGIHTISYELQFSNGYCYSGELYHYQHLVSYGNAPIAFSPVYKYYYRIIMPESNFNINEIHIFCDTLNIDVRVPIVIQ